LIKVGNLFASWPYGDPRFDLSLKTSRSALLAGQYLATKN
jgi:hypothetical protein